MSLRRWLFFILVGIALTLALGCTEESKGPALEPSPTPAFYLTPLPKPPDADLYEITQRLRLKSLELVPKVITKSPFSYQAGHRQSFSVTNLDTYNRFQVTAVLRYITPHAYWYVDEEISVNQQDLESSANEFENRIYPTVTWYFGTEWKAGVDNDPHLTILNSSFRGAVGYYSSADEYPQAVHPYSNERKMIYINTDALKLGSATYNSTLAHELQHALHWQADPDEESWVNEGLSVLAEDLAGFQPFLYRLFVQSPDVQLTHWEDEPARNGPHYGAAYLFMKYLAQHYGGYEALKDLVKEPADSIEGINTFLQKGGFQTPFEGVFKNWVVANYLGQHKDQRYSYEGIAPRVQPRKTITSLEAFSDTVHQYAAKYYEIRLAKGDVTLAFSGATKVKLVPNEPRSGIYQWWSNRGDGIDATLTGEFDLTGVDGATLQYWLWYDLEKDWDYAYIMVSDNGGKTWDILSGQHTTTENPVGNSFGPGYTGTSGGEKPPRWVQETVDLSRYAGRKVLMRFEYITDEAVNNVGLAIDDIAIPELGYTYDGESPDRWQANGFIRTDNSLAQQFLVQVIEFRKGSEAKVLDLPLNPDGRGEMTLRGFGGDLEKAVVVVTALAPATTEPASYQLSMAPSSPGSS